MDSISDDDLRKELQELTGKDTGPVMPSTKPALVKKLQRLREENKKAKTAKPVLKSKTSVHKQSQSLNNFGFSSDEEPLSNAEKSGDTGRKKSPNTKKSASTKTFATVSAKGSISVRKSAAHEFNGVTEKPSKVPSEVEILRWDNAEIQARLLDLSGTRYPVSDATKSIHVRKLRKLMASGDGNQLDRHAASSKGLSTSSVSKDAAESSPMETQFSDSDEEAMEFVSSPEVPANVSATFARPTMVNQSANTSSFLDVTLPDPPDHDPDCFIAPSTSRVIRKPQATPPREVYSPEPLPELPSKLPSPNLSSTRRSFVPFPPTTVSPPTFSKPLPPTPPRSSYARRPLKTSTHFVNLNQDSTPMPTSRFSAAISLSKPKTPLPSSSTDYSTRYSTGGGRVIDPDLSSFRREKAAKDVDMTIREKGKHLSHFYSKILLVGLGIFLASILIIYLYLRWTAPVPLGRSKCLSFMV